MNGTPKDLIVEALKPHSWHVKTNADGSLHGVCLGCFENGVLPEFDTWHEFADHLAAVIAALPDITIVPRSLLAELVDPDPCWFDHNGGCQAHGYIGLEPGETCPVHDARAILAAGGQS